MKDNRVLRGIVLAIVAQAVFALADTCAKLLSGRYSVFQIVSMQALFAGALLLCALGPTGHLRLSGIRNARHLALRGLLAGAGALTSIHAYSRLPLADVYAIVFCAPLLVAALAQVLGETVGPHRWIAVAIGFVGVLIMVRPGLAPVSTGHLAAVATAGVGAGVVLLLRSVANQEPRSLMILAVVLAQIGVSAPATIITGRWPDLADLGFVAIGGTAMALGQFLMVESLRLAPAATFAPVQYTKLIWGLGIGWAVFGDRPAPAMLLGAAFVIGAVVSMMRSSRP